MNWTQFLFSFEGRFNRAKYWLVGFLTLVVLIAIGVSVGLAFEEGIGAGSLILLLLLIPLFVAGLAAAVKRLHDRDKSGWWVLLFYLAPGLLDQIASSMGRTEAGLVFSILSAAISLWAFIELGFLRGTRGPNRYGPDPLEQGAPLARA